MSSKKTTKKRPARGAKPDFGPYMDNPESQVVQKRQATARGMRRLVVTGTVLLFISVVGLTFQILTPSDETPPPEVLSTDMNDAPGKSLATKTVLEWLNSDPQPVPGGTMVSWNGVTTSPAPASTMAPPEEGQSYSAPNYATELHSFTVMDVHGFLYESSIAIEVNATLGARVNTTPSLVRMPPSAVDGEDWGPQMAWWGYTETTAPDPVATAIQKWGEAFTSGDPTALRMTVGDPDPSHAYMPLGTAAKDSTETATVLAGYPTPKDGEREDQSMLLVRVELSADFSGVELDPSDPGFGKQRPKVSYDVLVEGADTASPRVVSWGAPGTGPTLSTYSIAVEGREIIGDRPEDLEPLDGLTPAPSDAPTAPATTAPAQPAE